MLGGGGVTLGSGSVDSLYETAGSGTTAGATGSDTTTQAASGNATNDTTYGTSLSSTEVGGSSSTETLVSTASDGADDRFTWGLVDSTVTAGSWGTDTASESGMQTMDIGSGTQVGLTSMTMSDSTTDTQYSASARTLGLDATISSGWDDSTVSNTATTSESTSEGGTQTQSDAAGGPAFSSPNSSDEIITGYNSRVETDNDTVATAGTIALGTSVSTSVARNTDDRTLNLSAATDSLSEDDHGSFSETMTATESMTDGGSVVGGSDSYTWDQSVDNLVVLGVQGGGDSAGSTIPGAYRLYYIDDSDQIVQNFHDVGSDVLGASDSIVAGSDSYTWIKDRFDSNSVTDFGTSATDDASDSMSGSMSESGGSVTDVYHVFAGSGDSIESSDVGGTSVSGASSRASDCYTYAEQSTDTAISYESDADSGTSYDGAVINGRADDSYDNLDIGTISTSDGTTYAADGFTLDNSNDLTGTEVLTHSDSTGGYGSTDVGIERSNLHAQGSRGDGGQDYTFHQGNYLTDDDNASQSYVGTEGPDYSVTNFDQDTQTHTEAGSVGGASGESFSFWVSDDDYSSRGFVGSYLGGYSGDFGGDGYGTDVFTEVMTSPPAVSTTYLHETGTFTDYPDAFAPEGFGGGGGTGLAGPAHAAGKVGDYRGQGGAGAVHMGTGDGALDDSSGLLSALGSGDAHPLEAEGPEMEESLGYGDGYYMQLDDGTSSWESSPTSMGYRRAYPGTTDVTITSDILSAKMSNGTANGSMANIVGLLSDGVDGLDETSGATEERPETEAQLSIAEEDSTTMAASQAVVGGLAASLPLGNAPYDLMSHGEYTNKQLREMGVVSGYRAGDTYYLFKSQERENQFRAYLSGVPNGPTSFEGPRDTPSVGSSPAESDVERYGEAVAPVVGVLRSVGLNPWSEMMGSKEEGLGSFLQGAISGDFSGNDTWSAWAGQVAGGLTPAGAAADARDTAAAVNEVQKNPWGVTPYFSLGIALIGWFAFGDILKGGKKAATDLAEDGAEGATANVLKEGNAMNMAASRSRAPAVEAALRAEAEQQQRILADRLGEISIGEGGAVGKGAKSLPPEAANDTIAQDMWRRLIEIRNQIIEEKRRNAEFINLPDRTNYPG